MVSMTPYDCVGRGLRHVTRPLSQPVGATRMIDLLALEISSNYFLNQTGKP
jgi:hypothetical protein